MPLPKNQQTVNPDEDCAEACPCGKPNWDEEAEEWVCPEAEQFCSVECEAKYILTEAKWAEEAARELAFEAKSS